MSPEYTMTVMKLFGAAGIVPSSPAGQEIDRMIWAGVEQLRPSWEHVGVQVQDDIAPLLAAETMADHPTALAALSAVCGDAEARRHLTAIGAEARSMRQQT